MQPFVRLIFVVLTILVPLSATGHQLPCGTRNFIVGKLERDYQETRRGIGIVGNRLMELWASSGCVDRLGQTLCFSWTILMSSPNGTSCVLSSGEWYQKRIPPSLTPGSPS